jgi:hypothetical protein
MIRRRVAALFSCLLVLTFSTSGNRVCDAMAHETAAQLSAHTTAESHANHSRPPSDSHRHSDERTPLDHCSGPASCASLVLAADVTAEAIDIAHSDCVVQLSAIVPTSQSPDLEPPPPKA